MTEALLQALGLAMVIEGIGPFLIPQRWREAMAQLARLPDRALRIFGAVTMGIGLLVLHWAGGR